MADSRSVIWLKIEISQLSDFVTKMVDILNKLAGTRDLKGGALSTSYWNVGAFRFAN